MRSLAGILAVSFNDGGGRGMDVVEASKREVSTVENALGWRTFLL